MKKILIIEDEKVLNYLLTRVLKEAGFDIEEAMSGEEGIKKMKTEKPDLVLLDLLLPGMNGFDVLAQIKKDSDLADIPVIVLSNLSDESSIKRSLELGASEFLVKANLDIRDIVNIVKKKVFL